MYVRSRGVGYRRQREDSAIEITLLASICIGSSGAILKFGGEWWTALYL